LERGLALAQRSRKRGRRGPPQAKRAAPRPKSPPTKQAAARPQSPPAHLPQPSRSEARNEEIRARLTPVAPGERPGAIVVGATIAGLIGVGQLIAFFAGLKIHGKTPAAGGTIAFCFLMIVCAAGMWRLWYGAVLGFMALLAIVATLFSLYLIEASNLLGLVVALVVVGGSGWLFFKLVRVLSRIQMPKPPGR
jgi:hypothetical protein